VPVNAGDQLLHFRIAEKIGEGGMGVVWKAVDTTLDREVALKILPPTAASDPARLARFEREAKLLASLNHGNIAAIHGLHAAGEVRFLTMELVDGEDLAARLRRGPLPMEEALTTCAQVAEALEAAHSQALIHRDLKPANILLTPDHRAKVLDFGLAKALVEESAELADLEHSPTITSAGSVAGIILGTAAYMSPEQARGKPLDKRTDIWSFGCVLYECLTGKPLFSGETVTDVLSSILQREPDWAALPERTPAPVRDLLERCLARNPRNRLHDIADARIILERSVAQRGWTTSGFNAAASAPVRPDRRRLPAWVLVAAGLVLGVAAILTLGPTWLGGSAELPLRKFRLADSGGGISRPQISPDGTRVAYMNSDRLWVRELSSVEPREVAGGEGSSLHAWSPDGNWLAISRDSDLWKVPATGGTPILLAELPESLDTRKAAGLSWGDDGRIAYNVGNAGLMAVPEQGGTPVAILEPGEGEQDFHQVHALPDGRGYLFVVHTDEAIDTIAVVTDEGRKNVLRIPGQDLFSPVYSPTGHMLFMRRPDNAGMWAVPFSLDRLEVTGDPFPVTPTGSGRFNVSSDGTLVFVYPAPPRETRLVLVEREGRVARSIGEPQLNQADPAISPDGGRVAVSAEGTFGHDIWVHEVESGAQLRLTFDEATEIGPAWFPTGELVGFARLGDRAGQMDLLATAADGSGDSVTLGRGSQPSFSPDGRFVAYSGADRQIDYDIWYAPLDEEGRAGEAVQLLETDGRFFVDFSPDGRLLVYASTDTGRSEIYITRFPGGDGKWQVSKDGGQLPVWSPAGDRIYYRQGRDLMEVPVSSGASPSLGQPRKLFTWESLDRGFDVTPDGRQFVMIEETDPGAPGPQITIVQNWAREFEKP
jgi:Tol biopolymer transport system component